MNKKVTSNIFDAPIPEFVPVDMDSYVPTRIDYFSASILQGLVSGRSIKNIHGYVRESVTLANALAEEIDKA